MKKAIIIVSAIIVLLVSISFSGCLEESKTDDKPPEQSVEGENLLFDPGFEDITSGYWDIAGFITYNITQIYGIDELGENILLGFKIENNTIKYHNEIKYAESMSAYIQGVDVFNFTVINNWYQKINDSSLIPHGKDVELSSWIKTKDAEEVILMIQCWDNEELSLDGLLTYQSSRSYENITGTNSWKEYSIKLINVPDETKVITVRLGLIGTGEVWFDDAKLFTIEYKDV